MPIDTRTNNQKLQVAAGEVLFLEGSPCNSLNILHEGKVSFEKKAGDSSIPLYILPGPNITLGASSLVNNAVYPYTIRSRSTCIISTYVMSPSTIQKTLASKLSLGMMVARTTLKEISEYYKKSNSILKFKSQVEAYVDNLSLLYFQCNPSVFPDIDMSKPIPDSDDTVDPILRLIRENLKNFQERGGILPDAPRVKFLDDDLSEFLLRTYSEEIELSDKEFHFIRKILSVNPKIQAALFESDPTLLNHSVEKLTSFLEELDSNLEAETEGLIQILDNFGGDESSLIDKYLLILELLETGYSTIPANTILPITDTIISRAEQFYNQYKSIFGSPYLRITQGLSKLTEKNQSLQEKYASEMDMLSPKPSTGGTIHAGVDIEAVKKELLNSASQILGFANINQDQVKDFSALMIKLKSLKNPLDSDPDIRKIRRAITKTYWDVYKTSFVKNQQNNNSSPMAVRLMLQYGYFDESLLDDEHIAFLAGNLNPSPSYREELPVHFGPEWLEQIYRKKVPSSIDELGQTFFEKVKLETRDVNYKKEADLPPSLDNPDSRLAFEIAAMYEPNARLTSGGPASHLPILTRYHITLPIEKCLVTKEKVFETVMEILSVDYTAFNREVIYNNEQLGIRSEFVQRSILPDMIVIPSIGSKIMMWQDLSIFRGSGAKESKGRFIIPTFVTGDFKVMMLEAVAAFRWELCKNIMGPDWNNVGHPSITADYTDYVQFFKKNKDLSIEIKEKLASEFKRFRTDRDKFANDYLLWMKYESEGVQRLNRVVRSIFYRHIPFHKEIRDKLSTQPAFSDIHNRFKNIRNRQHKESENRYKKYMNEGGMLPDVLQENLNYFIV
ncbi:MAG: cyclic nucleotide-binding domain-containing protein [Leptospira sp.]|nr:cyclic nucleotide-binding domain-containing protein [Leptospira sp.]